MLRDASINDEAIPVESFLHPGIFVSRNQQML